MIPAPPGKFARRAPPRPSPAGVLAPATRPKANDPGTPPFRHAQQIPPSARTPAAHVGPVPSGVGAGDAFRGLAPGPGA